MMIIRRDDKKNNGRFFQKGHSDCISLEMHRDTRGNKHLDLKMEKKTLSRHVFMSNHHPPGVLVLGRNTGTQKDV